MDLSFRPSQRGWYWGWLKGLTIHWSHWGVFRAVKALAFFCQASTAERAEGSVLPSVPQGEIFLFVKGKGSDEREREMAAYLPIGVVITMRGNNQPFVCRGGNSQQPCWTNEYVQSGYAHLCWGRKRKQFQSKCKAHLVMLVCVLFTVHSAFNSGFFVLTKAKHCYTSPDKQPSKKWLWNDSVDSVSGNVFFLTQSYSTGRPGDTAICHLAQH